MTIRDDGRCVFVRQSVFDPVSRTLPTDWWVQLWQRSVLFLVSSHKEKLTWTMFLSRTWNWAPHFCLIQQGLFWQRVAETVSPWGSAIPPTRWSRTHLWWEPRLCPRLHPPLLKAGLGDVLLLLLLLRRDPGGKQINSICYYSQWNKKNEMIFCLTSINLALFVS